MMRRTDPSQPVNTSMADYSQIKSQLEDQLRQRIERAEKIDSDLSTPGEQDWQERATELEDSEVLSSVGAMTVREIEQIKSALRQIEEGSYGVCIHCGQPIPTPRLEALPFATTCVRCQ